MMAKKGIGIIGYGGFGEFIHKAWDQMENAQVVAVCDSDTSRNPGGNVSFYENIAGILADENVDIISIATPPSSHKDLAIGAMEAGKHVLVEKPIALCEKDAMSIKQVSERTGRVATVDFLLRFNPIAEIIRNLIKSEVLGKLRRADLRNYAAHDSLPEGHWFWNPKISGRILLEHGVHFFDMAQWLINSPTTEIWSTAADRKPGMEDRVFAVVKYKNNVISTFWHSFSRPRPLETTKFHFAFDLGEIDMNGWIPLELNIWGWTDKRGLDILKNIPQSMTLQFNKIEASKVHSSEFFYDVEYEVRASVKLEESKFNVYAQSLRLIMDDLIKAVDNPSHKMRVTIDDAIEAVVTAEKATKVAHPANT